MENKGFEMQDDPGGKQDYDEVQVVGKRSPENGMHSNGKVAPLDDADPELAEARAIHEKEKENRDREPLLMIKWFVNKPWTWFAITMCGHIAVLAITAILAVAGYDILPLEFGGVPLEIRNDDDFLRALAWDERDEDENRILKRSGDAENQLQQTVRLDVLSLIFEDPDDNNVFTKANLMAIQAVEEDFLATEGLTDFCLRPRDGSPTCQPAESVIRFFDGTYRSLYPELYDPDFDNIDYILNRANQIDDFKQQMTAFLGKTAILNGTYAYSPITQSRVSFGSPLKGYETSTDRDEDQLDDLIDYVGEDILSKGNDYFSDGVNGLDFSFGSNAVVTAWVTTQVFLDLGLAIGSFAFIAIFMTIQTGSFWISGWSIFSILAAFVGTNLMYRVIFDFRYIGIFHVLSVFIILGIGADDVFVLVDTWKETAHHSYKSLAHRMSDCYRAASLAMLFTSLTTAIAFFMSASSPFLGIYSFGVFSGLLVVVNYYNVVTYLPSVIIVHHLKFEKFKCCCCCPNPNFELESSTPEKGSEERVNIIVRFFKGPYFRFVTHPIIRWVIIGFFVILLGGFIYSATTLEVNEEQIEFVDDSVAIGKYRDDVKKFQNNDDTFAKVYIVFGLDNQDLDDCHHSDPDCQGKTAWDPNFSMETPEIQNSFKTFCDSLLALDPDGQTVNDLKIKINEDTNMPEVRCFTTDMDAWLQARTTPANAQYPVTEQIARDLMATQPTIYDLANLPANYESWFETGMSYWLLDGFSGTRSEDFITYEDLLGEVRTDYTQTSEFGTPPLNFTYYYGTAARYMAIIVNTTLDPATLGYPTGLPIRDDWEDFIDSKRSTLASELQGYFQCTPNEGNGGLDVWHWLKVQENLVVSALIGIGTGIATALPILIIATHNIITGLYATLIICMIVTMVIGFIPMAGWKLGLLESVNLVLVVGLSVDYVVHLAEAYSRSHRRTRQEKVQDMLEEVGLSVLSGAITTLGASIFLLGAKIIFFFQFGLFMFCTIGFSIVYALGLFPTAMCLIGPEGETGSIKGCMKKCCTCCKKNSQE